MFGEAIRNIFWCGCYFLVNVMAVFSVGVGVLMDTPCMVFQIMCMLCQ